MRLMSVRVTSQVSWPSTRVAPKSWPLKWWGMAPLITAASVDLPAPEGPMTPTNSPSRTARSTWSRARSAPSLYAKETSFSSMIVFFSLTRSLSNDKKGQSLFIISYLMQSVRCGSSKEEAPAR